jgi:endo-1,4-beta-D-glucanase Y
MRFLVSGLALVLAAAGSVVAGAQQQPAGVNELLNNLTSEHVTRTAFTLDHDMLQLATGFLNDGSGPPMQLNSLTVENYRYSEPAFYIPETMHALVKDFSAAGWMHLVDQHASPKDSATPERPLTDLWLHYDGTTINGVTVLVRGRRQMSVIEVAGQMRPLDLVHLSGHFGIPKVDPGAVMVPAAPGK